MTHPELITVHQAYYGSHRGAHARLQTTFEDEELHSFLVQYTDRPGSLPAGVTMKPYTSGKVQGPYLLVTRTFADTEAERSGMVFTHVLAVDLNTMGRSMDVGILFDQLLTHLPPNRLEPLEPFELPAIMPGLPSATITASLHRVVQTLLQGNLPVVVVGSDEEVTPFVRRLWSHLPLSLRESFSFRASFTPDDIPTERLPTLVSVQPGLQNRWANPERLDAAAAPAVGELSPAEQWLLGLPAGGSFGAFVEELGLTALNFAVLRQLARAYSLHATRPETANCNDIRQLARLLAVLAPGQTAGVSLKQQALRQLGKLTVSGTVSDIKALRNLELGAFVTGQTELFPFVERAVQRAFARPEAHVELAELLRVLFTETEAERWWQDAVRGATKQSLSESNDVTARICWKLFTTEPALCHHLNGYFTNSKLFESHLIDELPPTLKKEVAEALLSLCLSRGRAWFRLHAHLLACCLPVEEALLKQLEVEHQLPLNLLPGLEYLATEASANQLIEVTLANGHEKLVELAGKRCADDSRLLNALNVRKPTWRRIWAVSIRITNQLTAGLTDPQHIIHAVFDLLTEGTSVETFLLTVIGESPFANLLDYPKCAELWGKLPVAERPHFVKATAWALVKRAVAEQVLAEAPETELLHYIRSYDFVTTYLYEQQDCLSAVLTMQNLFRNVSDDYFSQYLRNHRASVSSLDVVSLGEIIRKNSWSKSAKTLFEKARRDVQFRPALHQCKRLFEKWERLFNQDMFNESLSEEEWWEAFHELVLELYPVGPESDHIWKRAGGNEGILVNQKNRQENWSIALEALRRGNSGTSAAALLNAMKNDFPGNAKIQALLKR